jgi:hypothetical protein
MLTGTQRWDIYTSAISEFGGERSGDEHGQQSRQRRHAAWRSADLREIRKGQIDNEPDLTSMPVLAGRYLSSANHWGICFILPTEARGRCFSSADKAGLSRLRRESVPNADITPVMKLQFSGVLGKQ